MTSNQNQGGEDKEMEVVWIKLVGKRMVDNQSTSAHQPHILHSRVDWLYRLYVLDYILY